MRRGTTPTLAFTTDTDLSGYERVILTLKGQGRSLDFEGERLSISQGSITLTLTQEETLTFRGKAEAQIRAVTDGGTAIASDICELDFDRILKDGVINAGS